MSNKRFETYTSWNMSNDGRGALVDGMRVAMDCFDGAVVYGTLQWRYEHDLEITFEDDDVVCMNAFEAFLRDVRPA